MAPNSTMIVTVIALTATIGRRKTIAITATMTIITITIVATI